MPDRGAGQKMNWYCVHTRPRKESQVAFYLRETLQRDTYLPRLTTHKKIRGISRVITGPLFPRYLFCRMDVSTDYRAARYAPDVIDVVGFGERPAIVGESMIDELKGWAGEAVDLITLQPLMGPGDLVEITEGPMQGLQAVILNQRNDRDRVAVLLSMLKYGAQMIISRAQLARVN
jgi:transcriptional antiterminator RfaH